MDGDTRSRAIQVQSKTPHAFKLSDKRFHSRTAFPSAHRTQFNEWMRLKESKLDIDDYKSNFFDTINSDLEWKLDEHLGHLNDGITPEKNRNT